MYAFVLASGVADVLLLDGPRQLDALLHVLVLQEFENDVALRLVGVETGVCLLVILFVDDDRVLALGHFKVGFGARHTECVCLRAVCDLASRKRVGVYGDEEVGLVAVGYVGAGLERDEHIGAARVDHLDARTVGLHQPAELEGHVQVDVFFFREVAARSRVVAAVSGVDDEDEVRLAACGLREVRPYEENQGRQKQPERYA